jgi:hypothetical protein
MLGLYIVYLNPKVTTQVSRDAGSGRSYNPFARNVVRELLLQIVHESRDMERLDLRELANVFGGAPVREAAGGVHIGSSRMGVTGGTLR